MYTLYTPNTRTHITQNYSTFFSAFTQKPGNFTAKLSVKSLKHYYSIFIDFLESNVCNKFSLLCCYCCYCYCLNGVPCSACFHWIVLHFETDVITGCSAAFLSLLPLSLIHGWRDNDRKIQKKQENESMSNRSSWLELIVSPVMSYSLFAYFSQKKKSRTHNELKLFVKWNMNRLPACCLWKQEISTKICSRGQRKMLKEETSVLMTMTTILNLLFCQCSYFGGEMCDIHFAQLRTRIRSTFQNPSIRWISIVIFVYCSFSQS